MVLLLVLVDGLGMGEGAGGVPGALGGYGGVVGPSLCWLAPCVRTGPSFV